MWIQGGDVVKKGIGHLGIPIFYNGIPLPVRGFVPSKTHGETASEPFPHTSYASKSLQRGIHENVFASPNPHPGSEMPF
jgi:hypothetical protein